MGQESQGPEEARKKGGGVVWGIPPDRGPEIAMTELVTGKLHKDWHGPQEPEQEQRQVTQAPEHITPYTDDILKRAYERDAKRQQAHDKEPAQAPPAKGRDKDPGFDR